MASAFSLKGKAGKRILLKSDEIISVALRYHSVTYQDEWKTVLAKYQQVLEFINRHYTFTNEDIIEFQKLADEYGDMWASLTGRDGQTNYEHFIKLSHLSHYFELYGNMYKYSQQGFEAMMSNTKCIYQRATSCGGDGAEIRSHILQICHFLMRMMLWNSGHGDSYFHKKYEGSNDNSEITEEDLFVKYDNI